MINTELNFVLPKIKKPKLLDQIAYLQIKSAILSGKLSPGQPLVEVQLAKQLGTSKTPVRKALGRLEQDGWVTSGPFKSYRVANLTPQDVKEVYQFRRILECHLVRETARQLTNEDLEELESAVRAADQATEKGDLEGWLDANRAFHHVFDRNYGNKRVSDMLTKLNEHVCWILSTVHRAGPDLQMASNREHKLVLESIRKGDVESAVSVMGTHLVRFCSAILSQAGVAERGAEQITAVVPDVANTRFG